MQSVIVVAGTALFVGNASAYVFRELERRPDTILGTSVALIGFAGGIAAPIAFGQETTWWGGCLWAVGECMVYYWAGLGARWWFFRYWGRRSS